jgi:1,2-diacylglycerol 3-beta-galactosyltransferase
MSRPKRVLFAISDTGGGHRSGAAALHAALLQHPLAATYEYSTIDLITATGLPLLKNAPGLYDQLSTRWLPIFDLLYQITNGRRRVDTIAQIAYLSAQRNVLRTLEEFQPDLVVSVHPLANRFIGHARRTYNMQFRFITVVTDLVSLHTAWGDLDADLCVSPTQEGVEVLVRQGMPADKVVFAGFPVHPKFTACRLTSAEARALIGIQQDRYTVLLTAGGVGSGRLRELVTAIHEQYPEAQLLVVTGRNVALRSELQRLNMPEHVHVYGFVDNMEQLMAASDIVVTKAGPGTLMEALVMQRPVIITEAVGMQERGNITFVVERGLGAYAPRMSQIVAAVGALMDPVHHATTMQRLVDAVPRDGAFQISELIVQQLMLEPPTLMMRQSRTRELVPHWMIRSMPREEGSRRVRVLGLPVLKRLRRVGSISVQWGRRQQRQRAKKRT